MSLNHLNTNVVEQTGTKTTKNNTETVVNSVSLTNAQRLASQNQANGQNNANSPNNVTIPSNLQLNAHVNTITNSSQISSSNINALNNNGLLNNNSNQEAQTENFSEQRQMLTQMPEKIDQGKFKEQRHLITKEREIPKNQDEKGLFIDQPQVKDLNFKNEKGALIDQPRLQNDNNQFVEINEVYSDSDPGDNIRPNLNQQPSHISTDSDGIDPPFYTDNNNIQANVNQQLNVNQQPNVNPRQDNNDDLDSIDAAVNRMNNENNLKFQQNINLQEESEVEGSENMIYDRVGGLNKRPSLVGDDQNQVDPQFRDEFGDLDDNEVNEQISDVQEFHPDDMDAITANENNIQNQDDEQHTQNLFTRGASLNSIDQGGLPFHPDGSSHNSQASITNTQQNEEHGLDTGSDILNIHQTYNDLEPDEHDLGSDIDNVSMAETIQHQRLGSNQLDLGSDIDNVSSHGSNVTNPNIQQPHSEHEEIEIEEDNTKFDTV